MKAMYYKAMYYKAMYYEASFKLYASELLT